LKFTNRASGSAIARSLQGAERAGRKPVGAKTPKYKNSYKKFKIVNIHPFFSLPLVNLS
jgi:hypothetical protein